jgi:pimeloyl-ACP methyl ester carboxylesterase
MKTAPCQNSHPNLGACQTLEVEGIPIHLISEGKGPLVLFVHGSQAWSYTWRYQVKPFAEAMYQVVAPDLPGNGYSAAPSHHDYSVAGNSRLIGQVLDGLQAQQVILVASSAGGLPVLDFTIRHPERVSALILLSACGVPHSLPGLWNLIRLPLVGEAARLFLSPPLIRKNLAEAFADPRKVTGYDVEAYLRPLLRPGSWMANLHTERSTDPTFVEQNLKSIRCPVLIVWGKEDAWHPVAMAETFHQQLPQAEVGIFSNCGHLPHEEHPACFNQSALKFLEGKVK